MKTSSGIVSIVSLRLPINIGLAIFVGLTDTALDLLNQMYSVQLQLYNKAQIKESAFSTTTLSQ